MLHGVIESKRLITIKDKRKLVYYYMSKSMFKQFMQYFSPGIYVFMTVKKVPRTYRGLLVKNVLSIDKILSPSKNNPKVYYDISIIKIGIKSLINQNRFRLFIDFEMTMPPYTNYQDFTSEIIQAGYTLTDNEGKVIDEYQSFIKPKLHPELSIRTKKFLNISQEDVDNGKPYPKFHSKITEVLKEYNPLIYVWGKNDQRELSKLNRLYHLTNFTMHAQFIDLLSLHKTYYGLKNDLGLFNAYNNYYDSSKSFPQQHDAFEDAQITKDIFYAFKDVCNNKRSVKFD